MKLIPKSKFNSPKIKTLETKDPKQTSEKARSLRSSYKNSDKFRKTGTGNQFTRHKTLSLTKPLTKSSPGVGLNLNRRSVIKQLIANKKSLNIFRKKTPPKILKLSSIFHKQISSKFKKPDSELKLKKRTMSLTEKYEYIDSLRKKEILKKNKNIFDKVTCYGSLVVVFNKKSSCFSHRPQLQRRKKTGRGELHKGFSFRGTHKHSKAIGKREIVSIVNNSNGSSRNNDSVRGLLLHGDRSEYNLLSVNKGSYFDPYS